ncbi:MAG: DNA modification methylase [Phycisphaerales bacterium]|nr:DNA modification methylase [Phycisphaerales bacterium]
MALLIERIAVERIDPAPYNPRLSLQPTDPEYQKLKRSLETFGCVEPLVWNRRTGHLVGGHQRLKVLRSQGCTEVSVSLVDLSIEQEKALNVALNRIQGGWDEPKLAELLQGLTQVPDFDVSLTGFDRVEMGQLLDRMGSRDGEDGFELADALDEFKDRPAVTQPGELIELGSHRLLCGDSAKSEEVARLLDGAKADLVFTDPPYNVSYYGGKRPQPAKARPKRSRRWDRIYMDDLSQEDYEDWLKDILDHLLASLAPGGPYYLWNGHRQFGPMHSMLTAAGAHVSTVITWAKENFAIGYGDYHQQTEFCLYGWKTGDAETVPHRWYGPTNASTLWQVHRDLTRDYRHPTQKPIALAERALINSSRRDDIVLDLFLGSGTTLIAAERLQRRCFGMEIDPRYCDAIVRRYLACVDNAPSELSERYSQEVPT